MMLNNDYILIPKIFIKLTKSYETAALLSKIIYWHKEMNIDDEYFCKPYKELEKELFLSEYQIRRSIKVLKELNFIDTKVKRVKGVPMLHYKLIEENFTDWGI